VNEHTLTLRADNGRLIQFDLSRWKGLRVYTTESRTIAVGDRLQWREPDNRRRIANGEYATIAKLDARNIEVTLDKGRKLSMPLSDVRKIDLGHASTSHAAQGSTVDRVIVNVDSSRSPDLVNQRQFYVSLSRARIDARVYTNDAHAMHRAVARTQEKELALDVVQKPRQHPGMRI
jgi:ATP-dependent exoDNAse (exonuclease V) alpha subunit